MIEELSAWADDALHIHSELHFDLKDRLLILLGRTVYLHHQVNCQTKPGRVQTETNLTVDPFRWRRHKPCYAEASSDDPVKAQEREAS